MHTPDHAIVSYFGCQHHTPVTIEIWIYLQAGHRTQYGKLTIVLLLFIFVKKVQAYHIHILKTGFRRRREKKAPAVYTTYPFTVDGSRKSRRPGEFLSNLPTLDKQQLSAFFQENICSLLWKKIKEHARESVAKKNLFLNNAG